MKSTHKPFKFLIGLKEVKLQPGQFIFGRKKCSIETGLSEQIVRSCLQVLKSTNNITIKTTNKYSLISIVNWDIYQVDETGFNQQITNKLTNNQPTNNQQITTYKNIKNNKNNKKKERESRNGVPDWIKKDTWDDFKEFRIRIKAPLTDRAVKGIVTSLEKLKSQGHDPDAVLEQSIVRGWRGVFPVKSANKDDCPGFDWSTP